MALPWLAVSAASNLQAFPSPIGRTLNPTCGSGVGLLGHAVANLTCASTAPSLFTTGGASPASFQAAFVVVAAALLAVSYIAWRRGVTGRHDSFWNIPGFLLGMVLFLGVILLSRSLVGGSPPPAPGDIRGPSLWYLSLSVLLIAGGVSSAWVLRRAGRGSVVPEVPLDDGAAGMAAVLRRGIASLHRGDAPRSVIIECYRSMQELLRRRGVEDAPYMTAREFEEAGRSAFAVGGAPIHRLTALFERARYSDEALGAETAAEADSVLRALSESVRGGGRD